MIVTNHNFLDSNSGRGKNVKNVDDKEDHGLVYGNLNEDFELQNIQNPYYDSNVQTNNLNVTTADSPSSDQTEVIALTNNVYYEI